MTDYHFRKQLSCKRPVVVAEFVFRETFVVFLPLVALVSSVVFLFAFSGISTLFFFFRRRHTGSAAFGVLTVSAYHTRLLRRVFRAELIIELTLPKLLLHSLYALRSPDMLRGCAFPSVLVGLCTLNAVHISALDSYLCTYAAIMLAALYELFNGLYRQTTEPPFLLFFTLFADVLHSLSEYRAHMIVSERIKDRLAVPAELHQARLF